MCTENFYQKTFFEFVTQVGTHNYTVDETFGNAEKGSTQKELYMTIKQFCDSSKSTISYESLMKSIACIRPKIIHKMFYFQWARCYTLGILSHQVHIERAHMEMKVSFLIDQTLSKIFARGFIAILLGAKLTIGLD